SCGVSPAGTAFFLGCGGGGGGGGGAATGSGAGAGVSPGLPITRRRLTSTTTLLVRPWLKVCLTSPASSERLMPSGLRSRGVSLLSLIGFVSSFKSIHSPRALTRDCGLPVTRFAAGHRGRSAAKKALQSPQRDRDPLGRWMIGQRQMDDIVAAQCHRQSRAVQWQANARLASSFGLGADTPSLVQLACAVLARIGGMVKRRDFAHPSFVRDPVRAQDKLS